MCVSNDKVLTLYVVYGYNHHIATLLKFHQLLFKLKIKLLSNLHQQQQICTYNREIYPDFSRDKFVLTVTELQLP